MKLPVFSGPGYGGRLKKRVTLAFLSCTLAFVGARAAIGAPEGAERNKESTFVGTWKGICEDKKPFVIVVLHEEKGQIGGTVSIGNMHGNVDGCAQTFDSSHQFHAVGSRTLIVAA
jgi:hypothetical protein